MVLPLLQMPTYFLWDARPGRNLDHIARHGLTADLWEQVYHQATRRAYDKDDETVLVAEGRVGRQRFRILYAILEDGAILPLTVLPITGFPITQRRLS